MNHAHTHMDEIIDACIGCLRAGEPVERVLDAHPGQRAELRPALEAAARVLGMTAPAPGAAARAHALDRMLMQVTETSVMESGNEFRRLSLSFNRRSVVFRGAVFCATALLLGVASLGAAAATGNTPGPIRSILGLSRGTIATDFNGTVVSNDGRTMVVAVEGPVTFKGHIDSDTDGSVSLPPATAQHSAISGHVDSGTDGGVSAPLPQSRQYTVIIEDDTAVTRDGEAVSPADIAVGAKVHVRGSLGCDAAGAQSAQSAEGVQVTTCNNGNSVRASSIEE